MCLRFVFRYVVWVAFVGLVVISAKLVETGRIPFEFMPKVEGEILSAKLEMPLGVPFAETQEAVRRIEEAALRLGADQAARACLDWNITHRSTAPCPRS